MLAKCSFLVECAARSFSKGKQESGGLAVAAERREYGRAARAEKWGQTWRTVGIGNYTYIERPPPLPHSYPYSCKPHLPTFHNIVISLVTTILAKRESVLTAILTDRFHACIPCIQRVRVNARVASRQNRRLLPAFLPSFLPACLSGAPTCQGIRLSSPSASVLTSSAVSEYSAHHSGAARARHRCCQLPIQVACLSVARAPPRSGSARL